MCGYSAKIDEEESWAKVNLRLSQMEPLTLPRKVQELILSGEILILPCTPEDVEIYQWNYFLLWDKAQGYFTPDKLLGAKKLLLYSSNVKTDGPYIPISDVRAGAVSALSEFKQMHNLKDRVLILPDMPKEIAEQSAWYSGLILDKRPIALINSISNRKIAVSQGYCEMTGKSYGEWLNDENTKNRWSQSDFATMDDFLHRDGFICNHCYKAVHREHPGTMKEWVTNFKRLVIGGIPHRLSEVLYVEGVYETSSV